jgi:hypothetical protein
MAGTPAATPTYVPGTATSGGAPAPDLAPDLSILNKEQPKAVNPAADKEYLAALAMRDKARAFGAFANQVEQLSGADRLAMLANWGMNEQTYAAHRREFGLINAKAVEGPGGGESTDVPLQNDPLSYLVGGAAEGMAHGAAAGTTAVLSAPAMQTAIADTQAMIDRHFPNSPGLRNIAGTLLPVLATIAGGAGIAKLGGGAAPAAPAGGTEEEPAAEGTETPAEGVAKPETAETSAEGAEPSPAAAEGQPEGVAEDASGAQVAGPAPASGSAGSTPAAAPVPSAATTGDLEAHRMAAIHAEADARGGAMTLAQIQALATEGQGDHQVLTEAIDAPDLVRLGRATSDQVTKVINDARLALNYGNDDARAEVEAALKPDSPVMQALDKWGAAGHYSGLMQRTRQELPTGTINDTEAVLRKLAASPNPMDRAVMMLGSLDTPEERAAMLDQMTKTQWDKGGAAFDLYLNSILSLDSVGKKAASDAANILWQVPTRYLAAGWDRTAELATGADYGEGGVKPGEATALAKAMFTNFGSSLRVGLKSFITNQPAFEGMGVGFLDNPERPSWLEGSPYEGTKFGTALDFWHTLVSVPGRSILGIDQFAKSMHYAMNMAEFAARQGYTDAAADGLQGSELSARAAELAEAYRAKPQDWMVDAARREAQTGTFTAPLGDFGQKLDAARRANFAARVTFPFMGTPLNIAKQAIQQSPLAPISPAWRATMSAGGPDATIQGAKTALGSAIMGYLTLKAAEGKITGSVPDNMSANMREEWLRENEPYSILAHVDPVTGAKHWISHEGWEPWSTIASWAVDAARTMPYLERGDAEGFANVLGHGLGHMLDRAPMWGGLHSMMRIWDGLEHDEGSSHPIAEYLGRQAAALVPTSITALGGAFDPIKRQINDFGDALRSRIPWLKADGLATLDPFGRPVVVPPGFLWNEFPAFKSVTKGADPVVGKLLELHGALGQQFDKILSIPRAVPGSGPAEPGGAVAPEAIFGAGLTPAEQNRWIELRNQPVKGMPSLYDNTAAMIKSPGFDSLAPVDQAGAINREFRRYEHIALAQLIAESPSIQTRIVEAHLRKAASHQVSGNATAAPNF